MADPRTTDAFARLQRWLPGHRGPCTFARPCRACRETQDNQRTEPVRRALRQAVSMFEGLLVREDLEEGDAETTRRWVRRAKRALRAVYGGK